MTNPKHSRIVMLALEALTTEWLPEGTIADHVRRHERTDVTPGDLAFALRQLKRDDKAESVQYAGVKAKYWRRVLRVRAAA
jgi:hypothetical protein